MIKQAISKISNYENLEISETKEIINKMMKNEISSPLIASFLTALTMKGETPNEITGCVQSMRENCLNFETKENSLFEIVGTGGDKLDTFNISTVSSIVTSAAGVKIAKHGNRASSSLCGSADVLEALGINLNVDSKKNAEILEDIGFCFLFAQHYHSAMKYVAPIRKEIGIKTIFNIAGPLSNPAKLNTTLMGVYDKKLFQPLSQTLLKLNINNALLVNGNDNMDEISLTGPTNICEIKDGYVSYYKIQPEDFNLKRCSIDKLKGGNAKENAEIAINILKGNSTEEQKNIVLFNSGCSLYITKKAKSIEQGISIARETIESGKAITLLEKYRRLTN